jgi:hypothetical protein
MKNKNQITRRKRKEGQEKMRKVGILLVHVVNLI